MAVNPIQIQKFLKGVDYPASKSDLLRNAERRGRRGCPRDIGAAAG